MATNGTKPDKLEETFGLVPIGKLRIGENVRVALTDIDELAASIRTFGMIEPIIGCPAQEGGGMIEVLMGQRRLAAAQRAGLKKVPTLLRPRPDPRDRLLMQLAENLERADMTPMEEAYAFSQLVDQGMNQTEIAAAVNRSIMHVSTRRQLLDMPESLQYAIHERRVSPSVALSMPRVLFADKAAVKRLDAACRGGDNEVRAWAYQEVKSLQDAGETVAAKYQLQRPVSLPIEYVELAQAAAAKAGKSTREWIRDAIEAHAKKGGVVLPDAVTKVQRGKRDARSRI